ncbi:MAG: parA [Chloroflexi bacterium]|nr:MAG: parA [Chloroflexota bacterium]
MTWIVSIANEKGGVAKTTTTLSLSGALVELGYHVLVIDLDPQANLSLSLGCEPNTSYRSLINLFMENTPISEAIKNTDIDHLFLLPSNTEIGLAERILPARSGYEMFLKNLLSTIDRQFDFVLIDCPPFLGAITLNAIMASDLLILPTQAEYYSVFALRNMMSLIRQVRSKGNASLRYRLLITMFDKRNGIHRTLSAHLRNTFAQGVLDSVIEVDTRLRESPIAGLPIIYHASKSRAAMQYRFLAQEIISYVKE